MDIELLIQEAQKAVEKDRRAKAQPFYVKTIAWLQYLGLLRNNMIPAGRHHVKLKEVLKAGELEPRVLELLPAILIAVPEAIQHRKKDIPKDLAIVLDDIRNCRGPPAFRGIPAQKYLHWLHLPILDTARRRLDFRAQPRQRLEKTHNIGNIIREGRMGLSLTQEQFAEKHKVSLRIIRDLEQGKLTASVGAVNEILQVFGRKLRA